MLAFQRDTYDDIAALPGRPSRRIASNLIETRD